MQITTVTIFAILAALAAATPAAGVHDHLKARDVNCNKIVPACFGGAISGQTNCRCKGQKPTCDLWTCPGTTTTTMVCGQNETGCVYL